MVRCSDLPAAGRRRMQRNEEFGLFYEAINIKKPASERKKRVLKALPCSPATLSGMEVGR